MGPPPTSVLPPLLRSLLLSFPSMLLSPPGAGALCRLLQGADNLKADHYLTSPFHAQWGLMASHGILTVKT